MALTTLRRQLQISSRQSSVVMSDEDAITARSALSSPDSDGESVWLSEDTNTDLIIRSSDGIESHVRKAILSVVSPVFRHMFVSAQSEETIDVGEQSTTLHKLLQLCYPGQWPADIGSLDEVWEVGKAAEKYEMWNVFKSLDAKVLPMFAKQDPLAVFILACRDHRESIAKLAAIETLYKPFMTDADEEGLDGIPARSYRRLLDCHRKCTGAVNIIQNTPNEPWLPANSHLRRREPHVAHAAVGCPTEWCRDYISRGFEALRERPLGSITEPEFVWPSAVKAASCSKCVGRPVLKDLAYTAELMQAAIKEEAMKIVEETTFCV